MDEDNFETGNSESVNNESGYNSTNTDNANNTENNETTNETASGTSSETTSDNTCDNTTYNNTDGNYYNQNNQNNNQYGQYNGFSGQGNQQFNGFNGQKPPKKKNNAKIAAIIAGSIFAVLVIAAVSITTVQFVQHFATTDQNEKVAWGESKDNSSKSDKSDKANGDSAIATTEPVKVSESGSVSSGATDVSGIVESVMPCVVQIASTQSVDGYSMFGQRYQQEVASSGTGFLVGQNETELLIATNNHVVENSTGIQVTFGDDEKAEAIVKGTDADADLAVVAVAVKDVKDDTMSKIKVAVLGSSDDVKVGQMAVAIGNAQGMGQSVTVGYISAKDRQLDLQDESNGGTKKMTFLQTDAAINGGNSGGPLLDINGNVVGINSAKISDTQVEGMCYAIPISTAIPIINELMNRETLSDDEKGYMGVSLQDISDDAIKMYGVPDGVYVNSVGKDTPAEKAGIKEGDIITAINDVEVSSQSAASGKVNSYRAGTEIKITLYRQSGNSGYSPVDVKVTLGTADDAGIKKSEDKSSGDNNKSNEGGNEDSNEGNDDGNSYGQQSPGSIFDDMFPW